MIISQNMPLKHIQVFSFFYMICIFTLEKRRFGLVFKHINPSCT